MQKHFGSIAHGVGSAANEPWTGPGAARVSRGAEIVGDVLAMCSVGVVMYCVADILHHDPTRLDGKRVAKLRTIVCHCVAAIRRPNAMDAERFAALLNPRRMRPVPRTAGGAIDVSTDLTLRLG